MLNAIATSTFPSLSAVRAEVMPEEAQSRWHALLSFIRCGTAIPASLLGGLLWNIDPRLPFFCPCSGHIPQIPCADALRTKNSRSCKTKDAKDGPHVVIYGLPEGGLTSTAHLIQRTMKTEIIDASHVSPRKIGKMLRSEKRPVIVEGKPALYVAKEVAESMKVLLVASEEERTGIKARKSKKPEFVALKEVEEEDREVDRIARRLYRTDLSKMPPFDVATNTERVPREKIAKIITMLRKKDEEKKLDSAKQTVLRMLLQPAQSLSTVPSIIYGTTETFPGSTIQKER